MVAAVTDPYVSATDYKAWVGKTGTGDDTELAAQVIAASRFIDKECGDEESPRFFTQDASVVTRLFNGNGLTRLYVADIASLTGLVVKVDLDGDFDFGDTGETLTIGTHFKDHRVQPCYEPLRFEIFGAVLGEGDVGLRECYDLLLRKAPDPETLVMQMEMISPRDMNPLDAMEKSIAFIRSLPEPK